MFQNLWWGILLVSTSLILFGNRICAEEYQGKVVLVDKNCIDGEYILNPREKFLKPDQFPSIQDLIDNYNENNYMQFIYGVLDRRYPTGKSIIEQGGGKKAVDQWLHWKNSAQQVLNSLGTVVHEIGHGIDKQNPENWYFIALGTDNTKLSFTTPGMHGKKTTSNSPMYSMERSLLLADDQNRKRPPAQSSKIKTSKEFGDGPFGCDKTYAQTYLNGDPDDSQFDSGDQGYNSLIEEVTQYINSLALAYYLQDSKRPSSDRHAMLTWLWWNERYLRKIRTEHPKQYKYLIENQQWRELILTLWGRAWLYLNTNIPGMQPDTDYLHQLVQQKEVLTEIQLIRNACDCDNPEELLENQTAIHAIPEIKTSSTVSYPYTYTFNRNGKTGIVVNTTQKSVITLDIYDSKGRILYTLESNTPGAGKHTLYWDGRDFSGKLCRSGIYLYTLKINDTQLNAKLIHY